MARGAHYGPSPLEVDLPRKRRKVEDMDQGSRRGGSVHRDRIGKRGQSRRGDHVRSSEARRPKTSSHAAWTSLQQSLAEIPKPADPDQAAPKNRKSKKERKENPSSRIHSLRKQLKRGGLPPIIKRERDRELAALVFEQEKNKIHAERKRNLERYHFVRFIERQKATREVRKLESLKKKGTIEERGADIIQRLHDAEVDLMYTKYAPLGEKYISLYASDEQKGKEEVTQNEDLELLDSDQRAALEQTATEELTKSDKTIIRSSGHKAEDGTSMKPPRWYDVEAAMNENGLSKLKALRDGKIGEAVGPKDLVLGLTSTKAGDKRGADWLDDKGMIDPADLDSDSEMDMQEGGVQLSGADDKDDGDDMSDGDGGFFERR